MANRDWAAVHIAALAEGKTVSFRPRGNSMSPKIESGALVTVSPDKTGLKVGDIVLCTVKRRAFVHLIRSENGGWYTIGNNKGGTNGSIRIEEIHGRVVAIEP